MANTFRCLVLLALLFACAVSAQTIRVQGVRSTGAVNSDTGTVTNGFNTLGGIANSGGGTNRGTSPTRQFASLLVSGGFSFVPTIIATVGAVNQATNAYQWWITNAHFTVLFGGTPPDGARGQFDIKNTSATNITVTWPVSWSISQAAVITSFTAYSNSITEVFWYFEGGSNRVRVASKEIIENFGTVTAGQVVGFHDPNTKTNLTVGALTDGDKGDITVSSSGAAWAVDANVIAGTHLALASQAAGDIMYYNGTDWIVLAKGTAGQVLEMNAGATAPEWDTDDNSGANTTFDAIGDAAGNGTISLGTTVHQWITTLDGGDVLRIDSTDADATGATTTLLTLSHADQNDAQVRYAGFHSDSLSANTTDYEWLQTGWFSRLPGTNAGTFLNLGAVGFGGALNVAGLITSPGGLNLSGGTFTYRNSNADVALGNAGESHLNTTDEQLSFHSAADGEISGEVALPLIQHRSWSFDPDAVCDGAVDRLFLMTIGDQAPEGIRIVEWKASFEADPTTEADLDLKFADAFIGVANATVIDVLDTTAGVSAEDTNANINGGAAVANGKVMYLEFGTAYTEANHQIIFELWFYAEED